MKRLPDPSLPTMAPTAAIGATVLRALPWAFHGHRLHQRVVRFFLNCTEFFFCSIDASCRSTVLGFHVGFATQAMIQMA
ncbi:hypothetical protein B296_00008474 [Ensete ventricosum]|uniref:Uncharacterized protein n=1 Tax=Ensete ventricosum TaxID=4639 RepID=A0A427ARV1_ENSVE|nr:hypothetical protein B296_00008474 [Ensete ventricosum]